LGTVQDAGSPHTGCQSECCAELFYNPDSEKKASCVGIIDQAEKINVLLDASPDFSEQCKILRDQSNWESAESPDYIFLTHAHIGHYTGLMYLGREAFNADAVPVYCMPRMIDFLSNNGPWNQLLRLKNIELRTLSASKAVPVSANLTITSIEVPHRDEYSETVGFLIEGPNKKALFIPDIEKWSEDILIWIEQVDYAFLDGTFYSGDELGNRDMKEVPHPSIVESMETFKSLSNEDKDKVYFIHLNHTNRALNPESEEGKSILENGFHLASFGEIFDL